MALGPEPASNIDSIIHLASVQSKVNFSITGRTVERLGISEMNARELQLFMARINGKLID